MIKKLLKLTFGIAAIACLLSLTSCSNSSDASDSETTEEKKSDKPAKQDPEPKQDIVFEWKTCTDFPYRQEVTVEEISRSTGLETDYINEQTKITEKAPINTYYLCENNKWYLYAALGYYLQNERAYKLESEIEFEIDKYSSYYRIKYYDTYFKAVSNGKVAGIGYYFNDKNEEVELPYLYPPITRYNSTTGYWQYYTTQYSIKKSLVN